MPPKQLEEIVTKLKKYFDSFKNIYTGRERTIDIIMYAMLQKAHTLFFGVPGTAKTSIPNSIFQGITKSGTTFEVQMTAFMAEDALFGPYNIKKMRDEGILEHNVQGMLPEATFALFDEMLDANPAVLRSLLSSLNERQMVKGRQVLDLPLHMAYCATNIDPYVFLKRNPQAWAVFDRISFLDRISYLDTADEISEMVKRFQYRTTMYSQETIDISDINALCDYILLPPTLIQDQLVLMKYAEAVVEYRQKRAEKMLELEKESQQKMQNREYDIDYKGIIFSQISDRRICWASQMLEVNAVLNGRIKVQPEDMYAAHFLLGTSEVEKEIWDAVVKVKIEEINELKRNQLSDLQQKQIQHFRDQFEDIRKAGHDLEVRVNGIGTLIMQIGQLKPENEVVADLFNKLKEDVEAYKKVISQELLDSKGLGDKHD